MLLRKQIKVYHLFICVYLHTHTHTYMYILLISILIWCLLFVFQLLRYESVVFHSFSELSLYFVHSFIYSSTLHLNGCMVSLQSSIVVIIVIHGCSNPWQTQKNVLLQDFTSDFYFRQIWKDNRLSFMPTGGITELVVGADFAEKIWVPDTFFANEKLASFHIATTPNTFLRIASSGEVYRSIR